jgi:hypothetical protein
VAAPALALAAPAPAAASGTTTLTLDGAAGRALVAAGVRVAAVSPARSDRVRLQLPVAGGTVGAIATLRHDGALRLRRDGRTLTLRSLQVRLGTRARLSALVAGQRTTLAVVDPARTRLDPRARTAVLPAATARLTRAGALLLQRRLRLARAPQGSLGRLAVDAALGAPAPGAPPAPPPAGAPAACRLTRPASALDVTAAGVTWHVRPSFIQYINAGEGTTATAGASDEPKTVEGGSDAPLVYSFGYTFASGWYDPSSGTAAVRFTGTVNFSYRAHTIDLDASDPEVQLAGADSCATFAMRGGRRAVLVDLDPARAQSASATPDSATYGRIPGAVPEGAADSVFAGFYQPGEPFGAISISFTTRR